MDLLGTLFFLYILFAFGSGAIGLLMLLLNRNGSRSRPAAVHRSHFFLLPLYLLLLAAAGSGLWGWYTDATYFTPARADLVGQYVVDKEHSDANLESTVSLTLNADSTYVLTSSLMHPSRGTWAMPNWESPPFEPALVLSRPDDFYQVVVIRQAQTFRLGIQGRDPDDTSVLALKKRE
ncbi:hypothetical protein [Hymenobacter ruricola]|uniref:Uncharacterized protein n=1 Tax=Hymenobacter ruricola TaxID=2791023 RepID=A0ABS0HZM3_9BACT|nr:hypothetical protein [Hymenobacter ruricola]MBF9220148.1 hypothetical protein [Hymenobacter ruricola]